MTYRLAALSEGSNSLYWLSIDQLIGEANIPIQPDASYIPQSEVVKTLSGLDYARGFAVAVWHWNGLTNRQRAILRAICPGQSAEIYIETSTNELTACNDIEFIQCSAICHWMPGDEVQEAGKMIGLDLTFTHLVEIS